ncbi:unnamed protein product [Amoebophrya sp. A120]|nr:unnamed protein product [Amoebophrya sp. A120]|eukprot:GSA120T00009863001.1
MLSMSSNKREAPMLGGPPSSSGMYVMMPVPVQQNKQPQLWGKKQFKPFTVIIEQQMSGGATSASTGINAFSTTSATTPQALQPNKELRNITTVSEIVNWLKDEYQHVVSEQVILEKLDDLLWMPKMSGSNMNGNNNGHFDSTCSTNVFSMSEEDGNVSSSSCSSNGGGIGFESSGLKSSCSSKHSNDTTTTVFYEFQIPSTTSQHPTTGLMQPQDTIKLAIKNATSPISEDQTQLGLQEMSDEDDEEGSVSDDFDMYDGGNDDLYCGTSTGLDEMFYMSSSTMDDGEDDCAFPICIANMCGSGSVMHNSERQRDL